MLQGDLFLSRAREQPFVDSPRFRKNNLCYDDTKKMKRSLRVFLKNAKYVYPNLTNSVLDICVEIKIIY